MMDQAKDLTSQHISNFRVIDEILFVGAQPGLPAGINELADKYAIKTVIDLQGELVDQERAAVLAAGIPLFVSCPLPGIELFHELPMDKVNEVIQIIELPANQPVFINCKHGSDRSGAIVGCYRIAHGATVAEAIAEMRHYGDPWFGEWGMRDTISDFFEQRSKTK